MGQKRDPLADIDREFERYYNKHRVEPRVGWLDTIVVLMGACVVMWVIWSFVHD